MSRPLGLAEVYARKGRKQFLVQHSNTSTYNDTSFVGSKSKLLKCSPRRVFNSLNVSRATQKSLNGSEKII